MTFLLVRWCFVAFAGCGFWVCVDVPPTCVWCSCPIKHESIRDTKAPILGKTAGSYRMFDVPQEHCCFQIIQDARNFYFMYKNNEKSPLTRNMLIFCLLFVSMLENPLWRNSLQINWIDESWICTTLSKEHFSSASIASCVSVRSCVCLNRFGISYKLLDIEKCSKYLILLSTYYPHLYHILQ